MHSRKEILNGFRRSKEGMTRKDDFDKFLRVIHAQRHPLDLQPLGRWIETALGIGHTTQNLGLHLGQHRCNGMIPGWHPLAPHIGKDCQSERF